MFTYSVALFIRFYLRIVCSSDRSHILKVDLEPDISYLKHRLKMSYFDKAYLLSYISRQETDQSDEVLNFFVVIWRSYFATSSAVLNLASSKVIKHLSLFVESAIQIILQLHTYYIGIHLRLRNLKKKSYKWLLVVYICAERISFRPNFAHTCCYHVEISISIYISYIDKT